MCRPLPGKPLRQESLRDIETCLGGVGGKLYDIEFRSRVVRSALAELDHLFVLN